VQGRKGGGSHQHKNSAHPDNRNRAGTGKNIQPNYTQKRTVCQMPDYISAMDIDEIVDYILEKED
jgi:hypothetical protein